MWNKNIRFSNKLLYIGNKSRNSEDKLAYLFHLKQLWGNSGPKPDKPCCCDVIKVQLVKRESNFKQCTGIPGVNMRASLVSSAQVNMWTPGGNTGETNSVKNAGISLDQTNCISD